MILTKSMPLTITSAAIEVARENMKKRGTVCPAEHKNEKINMHGFHSETLHKVTTFRHQSSLTINTRLPRVHTLWSTNVFGTRVRTMIEMILFMTHI